MKKILIVEDDNALSNGLCRALTAEGITTDSADTLSLGEKKLADENYSLVILDVNLPDGNGFDFLARIRQKALYRL